MIVVRGRSATEMDRPALDTIIEAHERVVVDLGAGDGKWAYRLARREQRTLVIAADPVRENLREASARAAKKRDRGGAPNALFVAAGIEQMPDELAGVADEIYITLPWGSLMRGIALGEAAVVQAIARLGKPGAAVRVVLNTRIFDDPVPIEARDLPEVTPAYVRETLAPAFARAGLTLVETREMNADEVSALGTTWSKRLSHARPPRSVLIEARVEAR
jgi:16S rRNA (adenine(1408)-N(1))-methyltransferase